MKAKRQKGDSIINYDSSTFDSVNLANFISNYYNAKERAFFTANFELIERKTVKKTVGPKSDKSFKPVPYHIVCDFDTFKKIRNISNTNGLYLLGRRLKRRKDTYVLIGERTNIFDPSTNNLQKQFQKDDGLQGALLDLVQERLNNPDKDEKEIMDDYVKKLIQTIREEKNKLFQKIN